MKAPLKTWSDTLLDRLPIDRLEFREVDGHGKIPVGRLARLMSIAPHLARTVMMNEDAVMSAARATMVTYCLNQICRLPKEMARQPLLACEEDDRIFLLDGLQRAGLAFAQGVPTVRVLIVPMDLAKRLRSRHSLDEYSRLFEATRNHPVGAKPGCDHTTAIVQLAADTDRKREGQRLTKLETLLKDLLLYLTICAVERELAYVETLPKSVQKKLDEGDQNEDAREQRILNRWKRQYNLPVAPPWKVCANEAKRVIALFTSFNGKPALDSKIRSEISKADLPWVNNMREQAIRHRNILLKAFTRAKEHGSYASHLVALDHDKSVSDETAIKRARVKFLTWPINFSRRVRAAASQKQAEDALKTSESSALPSYGIDFVEQLILAKGYAINPTSFCGDCTRADALFEAYAYAHLFELDGRLPSSPAMVETYLQQRALADAAAQAGHVPQDLISRFWADLFKYYAAVTYKAEGNPVPIAITDAITMDVLREMDELGTMDGFEDGTIMNCVPAICF